MSHKHPEDRERAADVFAAVARDGGTYSCCHRIVDRDERVLSVVSVGGPSSIRVVGLLRSRATTST